MSKEYDLHARCKTLKGDIEIFFLMSGTILILYTISKLLWSSKPQITFTDEEVN